MDRRPNKDLVQEKFSPGSLVGIVLGQLCFLTGLALLAFQVFAWLRTGEWPALSLGAGTALVFHWVFGAHDADASLAWLDNWRGIEKLLEGTPLCAALVLIGLLLTYAAAASTK